MRDAPAQFPPALWSVVLAAGKDSSPRSHEALASLCQIFERRWALTLLERTL